MSDTNKLDQYINSHPKESLRFVVVCLSFVWHTVGAALGVVSYVAARFFIIEWWVMLGLSVISLAGAIYLQHQMGYGGFVSFVKNVFADNHHFWKFLLDGECSKAISSLHLGCMFNVPLLMAGLLGLTDLIPSSAHAVTMNKLQEGVHPDENVEIKTHKLVRKLNDLHDADYNGTLLGISKYSGKPVVMPDRDINQMVLVLGTTGAGKTVTLRRFYNRAIRMGYPLIIVDGKPDDGNIVWLVKAAEQSGRPFYGFNCANYCHYDPLANGGFTELKDKIISLKDQWENDYYRSIAEDYLQTTFAALLKAGKPFDLKRVVECLAYNDLALLGRETNDERLIKKISALANYERKDITGLQAHLNLLLHSELGEYFEINESTFTLPEVIRHKGVAYFALPALRFPSFSKVLGKLVINDIKAVIDRNSSNTKPIFTVFDEFSVFAGEQVLNLVNMGRGKGVHAVFGTQGLADLDKVDVMFKSQIMNCANTLICHRLNDVESAEMVANWVGTKDVFTVTAQLSIQDAGAGLGSVRSNKEYIVHPDAIKQGLKTGEAFWVSKMDGFRQDKVVVKWGGVM